MRGYSGTMAANARLRVKRQRPSSRLVQEAKQTIDNEFGDLAERKIKLLRRRIPPRLRFPLNYSSFKLRNNLGALGIDERFIGSLTHGSRVLEIGAGSGRLADYLLRHSGLRPENYEILDWSFKKNMPFVKRRIFQEIKSGKIKVFAENMVKFNYPKDHYDHILIPEAFFPGQIAGREILKQARRSNGVGVDESGIALRKLAALLAPALRPGGTIRISSQTGFASLVFNGVHTTVPGFKATRLVSEDPHVSTGVILQKNQ